MQNPMSVEDQFRICRKEAERNGWAVVGERADHGISGARNDRPGYQALCDDIAGGRCDIVLIEHLDRLSRDHEHAARFYKIARHHDVEIHHFGQGRVTPIHIGFTSTMAALYLDDLAYKTRRGLAGRVLAGKSAGGLSYGYRTRRDEAGNAVVGEVVIDEREAAVVRRIFREYAEGRSPLKIAAGLNLDGIPSPRGRGEGSGHWKQNTINGNRERGTGILNNEFYVGRRVWNRLRYSKDPHTGRRVSRLNEPSQWETTATPQLRIVEDGLWAAVKERLDRHADVSAAG